MAECVEGMLCLWFGRQNKLTKIKREGDGAMAIGGCRSMRGHNNQPKVGFGNGKDIREGARPQRNLCGGRFVVVWGGKLSTKINKDKNTSWP
jgi:hypothetical protein